MDGLGVGDIRTEARGTWLFDRIGTTGSVVSSIVGGSEAGTASAHDLTSPQTSVRGILPAFGRHAARLRRPRGRRGPGHARDRFRPAGRHGLGPSGNGRNPGFFLHPVATAAEARETVRLYPLHWYIEEVFRTLKGDGLGLDAT